MRTALLCLFAVLLTATVCQSLNPCPCIKISSKIVPLLKTKSYYLQKSGLCDITAAVLTTEKGRKVCADPNKPWVIKAMKFVEDKRRTTASAMFTASEPTVITTAMTWSSVCCLKNNPPINGLHVKHVVDCKVQKAGHCPFDAIIIKTRKGQTLCYDPMADWVTKHVVMKGTDSCEIQKRHPKRKRKQGIGNIN
ncbi:C-C motif chemokine 2-like isoform X4 [Tachysurus fulvidraco]|uniref:C-C motif chemokine 2-like isoform X4 n=1 Tax=Tachysurus fulvidraco TaxID=1234273 RepID=UPI000F4E18B0|nr:C-C motif chemokine 2-like isoform X4 [Tachysurus fulvidraco]